VSWYSRIRPSNRLQWTAVITVAVLIVTGIGGAIVTNLLNIPSVTGYHAPPRDKIASQPLRPNLFEQTRSWFGPWQITTDPTAQPTTIVMLRSSGAAEISSVRVIPNASWVPEVGNPVELDASGQKIMIRTDNNHIFTVAVGQPFIVDSRPDIVLAVVPITDSNTLIAQSATWVRSHSSRKGR